MTEVFVDQFPDDLMPGDTLRTEFEARWHGFARWGLQTVARRTDGGAVVLRELNAGWRRRPRAEVGVVYTVHRYLPRCRCVLSAALA